MVEILAALVVFVFVIAFWRGLWTLVIGLTFTLFVFMIGGGFVGAALYNDTVIAIVLALVPAGLFGIYRIYQTRKLERMLLHDRIMKTRISANYEKFGAVRVDGEGAVVGIDEGAILPTDGRSSSGHGNWACSCRPSLIHDCKTVNCPFGAEAQQIAL